MTEILEQHSRMIDFFNRLWDEGEDPKTEKMGYSERSGNIRMTMVAEMAIENKVSNIIDVGCGTGRLIDVICEHGFQPDFYLGVDVFSRNADHVHESLSRYGVPGAYMQIQYPTPPITNDLIFTIADVGTGKSMYCALGIVGYGDLENPGQVIEHIQNFREIDHGFVTIPKIWNYEKHCPDLTYFTEQTIRAIGRLTKTEVIEMFNHEWVLVW